jgi:LysM repeat protein
VLGVVSTLFLLLVVLFSGRLSADAGTSLSEQGRATGVVVVQAGESLWQIAQAVAPQADPRETVTLLRELNGLGDAAVVPGQSIVVPVTGAPGA